MRTWSLILCSVVMICGCRRDKLRHPISFETVLHEPVQVPQVSHDEKELREQVRKLCRAHDLYVPDRVIGLQCKQRGASGKVMQWEIRVPYGIETVRLAYLHGMELQGWNCVTDVCIRPGECCCVFQSVTRTVVVMLTARNSSESSIIYSISERVAHFE